MTLVLIMTLPAWDPVGNLVLQRTMLVIPAALFFYGRLVRSWSRPQ